ncbi:hypothetical protein FOMPIDRAFT_1050094 [Fomitopsis schrenkii]|uniref:Uncharacterized protein n=1 Tax=Fomitopsis schrenkii TaxID=2126942 RepID=S8FET6_FOMSC|nr:hypothetical protein FOMPIDRAFT_1050094 [Fomitopsis schrenkii]
MITPAQITLALLALATEDAPSGVLKASKPNLSIFNNSTTARAVYDPTFDCGVDESEDLGQRTAMLFVKLSGGRYVLIFSRTASHLPHRVMRLSSWTTFASNNTVHMIAWTFIVHGVIHLYQAKLNNVQHFALLTDCFERNAADPYGDVDDDRSDEQDESEIAEISRRFRACLRYGKFDENLHPKVNGPSVAFSSSTILHLNDYMRASESQQKRQTQPLLRMTPSFELEKTGFNLPAEATESLEVGSMGRADTIFTREQAQQKRFERLHSGRSYTYGSRPDTGFGCKGQGKDRQEVVVESSWFHSETNDSHLPSWDGYGRSNSTDIPYERVFCVAQESFKQIRDEALVP